MASSFSTSISLSCQIYFLLFSPQLTQFLFWGCEKFSHKIELRRPWIIRLVRNFHCITKNGWEEAADDAEEMNEDGKKVFLFEFYSCHVLCHKNFQKFRDKFSMQRKTFSFKFLLLFSLCACVCLCLICKFNRPQNAFSSPQKKLRNWRNLCVRMFTTTL